MEIVINSDFGGFGLSNKAYEKLIEYGIPVREYVEGSHIPVNEEKVIFDRGINRKKRYLDNWIYENRSHPLIIKVVKDLKAKANGTYAKLKIVNIPDDVEWEIDEYDGREIIREIHRTWN